MSRADLGPWGGLRVRKNGLFYGRPCPSVCQSDTLINVKVRKGCGWGREINVLQIFTVVLFYGT